MRHKAVHDKIKKMKEDGTKFVGWNKRQMRQAAIDGIEDILMPLLPYINRKIIALQAEKAGCEKYAELTKQLRECRNDKEKEEEIFDEMDKLSDEIGKMAEDLAFREPKKYTPEQHRMYVAVAQYMDEWCDTGAGKLRAYYTCKRDCSGSVPPCGTVIASKMWARKNEDITEKGQAWYCCMCGCKYNTNDGMLVEFYKNGQSYFLWAECPRKGMEDIKNMALEASQEYQASIAISPKAFYDQIPDIKPMDIVDFMRPCNEADVQRHDLKTPEHDINYFFKFLDVNSLKLPENHPEAIPTWKWESIVELFRQ